MKLVIIDLDGCLFDTHDSGGLYPDVPEALDLVCRTCTVILLTAGNEDAQFAKLEGCGIRDSFNDIVVVKTGRDKADALKGIVAEYSHRKPSVFVVGDRVDLEIFFGNQLGLTTVRIRRPGGKYSEVLPRKGHEHPVHEIDSLPELVEILDEA